MSYSRASFSHTGQSPVGFLGAGANPMQIALAWLLRRAPNSSDPRHLVRGSPAWSRAAVLRAQGLVGFAPAPFIEPPGLFLVYLHNGSHIGSK